MNRKIIIALIIIILIAIVGAFALTQSKTDTQINFLNQTTVKNGDAIQFELKDAQGNVLANQEVSISFTGNNESQNYTVITDNEGKGALVLSNENPGSYNINVTYAGDDEYNGCSASQIITVEEGTSDASTAISSGSQSSSTDSTSSSSASNSTSSSSSSNLNYDSELNEYYDDNGKIVGGQNDGSNYEDVKNNQPVVDEEGNLV